MEVSSLSRPPWRRSGPKGRLSFLDSREKPGPGNVGTGSEVLSGVSRPAKKSGDGKGVKFPVPGSGGVRESWAKGRSRNLGLWAMLVSEKPLDWGSRAVWEEDSNPEAGSGSKAPDPGTFRESRIGVKASGLGAQPGPWGHSPVRPSFCVLLFGWSHLPSPARTNSGLPSPGIPGHAPPRATSSPVSASGERGGAGKSPWPGSDSPDKPRSRRSNPASAPNGWGTHPLLISEFPLVQVERNAVRGIDFFVCFRGDILPGQVHFLPRDQDRYCRAGTAQINRLSGFLSTRTE